MGEFLHALAQELRTREQFLEDHNQHPSFELTDHDGWRRDFTALVARIKEFARVIEEVEQQGQDIDLSMREELENENKRISVQVDFWKKRLN